MFNKTLRMWNKSSTRPHLIDLERIDSSLIEKEKRTHHSDCLIVAYDYPKEWIVFCIIMALRLFFAPMMRRCFSLFFFTLVRGKERGKMSLKPCWTDRCSSVEIHWSIIGQFNLMGVSKNNFLDDLFSQTDNRCRLHLFQCGMQTFSRLEAKIDDW